MKNIQNFVFIFFSVSILACSKEEFPEMHLPEVVLNPPEAIGLDSIHLTGSILPTSEEFQVESAGFRLTEGEFNDEWEGVDGIPTEDFSGSLHSNGQFSATIPYDIGQSSRRLMIAPFAEIGFSNKKQKRQIYGQKRSFQPSLGINLSLIVPELTSNDIKVFLNFSGLSGRGLTFSDFGIIWVGFEEEQPPGFEFDWNTPGIDSLSEGSTNENIINLRLQPEFPWGQYVYVRPYAVYKEKRFLGETRTLFIGDFWESIPAEGYASGLYPGQLYGTIGFSLNGKGYVFGGRKNTGDGNDPPQSTLWEFHPETRVWRAVANLPVSRSGEPAGRHDATAFAIGDKAYIGLGRRISRDVAFQSFFEYTPESGFREVANYPNPAYRAASFVIGEKAYVGTGASPNGTSYSNFFSFDPNDGTTTGANGLPMGKWEEVSACPIAIEGAVGFTIGDKGYVGTGYTRQANTLHQEFYEFDPSTSETGTWKTVAPIGGTARQIAMAFVINDKAYVGGGANFATGLFLADHKDFWEFDPRKNNWVRVEDIGLYPRSAAASFTIGDKGYVYGGYIQSSVITTTGSIEIYTPDF